MYDNFIQNVNGSEYRQILNSCDTGEFFRDSTKEDYKNMCKKLSRNLLLLSNGDYEYDKFFKYCDMLYIWMYFEIKEKGFSNSIIEEIFKHSVQMITQKLKKKYCSYFSFSDKLQEPEKLIKLRILEHNTSTFQNILNYTSDPNNCPCLKYVYECINIYIDMNNRFCATHEDQNTINKGTCDILKNFNTSYSTYIHNVNRGIYEFPILSDTTTDTHTLTATHLTRCSSNIPITELGSSEYDQSSSPKQVRISTALSTMVGIPPFLALIYKVNIICTWNYKLYITQKYTL
ncbi:hypothetical protein PVMG_05332 [Plasmodium vivax Mauritania I]|uniref:Variable surface protein n=1 Tax=Plasmodium vivax Mauritania I TaxID=1035515 RepID=A0A0J9W5J2_PLAVI|nr:hypothetical protein PVMG_05332 [Plasmodium vivax Mauritania I]